MEDKVIQMLGAGVSPARIALALGVNEGDIAQFLSDDAVRARVAELRMTEVERALSVDELIEDTEQKVLEKLNNLVPFMSKPRDLLATFSVMNGAKKKTDDNPISGQPTAPLVQINISQQAAIAFKISGDSQVVEVDGRSMATLPARVLKQQLEEKQKSRPAISDATTAGDLIRQIESGIPEVSMANVL